MAAPEDDDYAILHDLWDLYPDFIAENVKTELRPSHRRAFFMAHGWYVRCHRTTQALLVLEGEGFNGEAAPLRRTVTEHTIALRWLAAEGDQVLPTLAGRHSSETGKRVTAVAQAGWTSVDLAAMAAVKEEIDAISRDRSNDNLQHFKALNERHGDPHSYVTFQVDSARCHATYQSAMDYIEADGESQDFLTTSRVEVGAAAFSVVPMYRASAAFAANFAEPIWEKELAEIGNRIRQGIDDVRAQTGLPAVKWREGVSDEPSDGGAAR